jgi:DinB family protein
MSSAFDELAPKDAAVAIRSMPRRFREVLAQFEPDDDPRAWRSVVKHAIRTRDAMDTAAVQLRRVLIEVRPELHELPDSGADVDATGDVTAILADLQRAAERLARTIDSADAGDWLRQAVLNGTETTALDIVRHVVQRSVHHLREAEEAAARAQEGIK